MDARTRAELAHLNEALAAALQPVMHAADPARPGPGHVAWMASKALRCLIEASQAPTRAQADEALADVEASLLSAADLARRARAGVTPLPDLAKAINQAWRNSADPQADQLHAVVVNPVNGDVDTLDAATGDDEVMTLRSHELGWLPVDGATQLRLAAAMNLIAQVYMNAGCGERQ